MSQQGIYQEEQELPASFFTEMIQLEHELNIANRHQFKRLRRMYQICIEHFASRQQDAQSNIYLDKLQILQQKKIAYEQSLSQNNNEELNQSNYINQQQQQQSQQQQRQISQQIQQALQNNEISRFQRYVLISKIAINSLVSNVKELLFINPCPNCNTQIEGTEIHLTCTNCYLEFCSLCFQPYNKHIMSICDSKKQFKQLLQINCGVFFFFHSFALFSRLIFSFIILLILANSFIFTVIDIFRHKNESKVTDVRIFVALGLLVLFFIFLFTLPNFIFFLIGIVLFTGFLITTMGFGRFNWLMIQGKEFTKEVIKNIAKKI